MRGSSFLYRPHHIDRSAVVSGSPLVVRAARQTQERHADSEAAGRKHHLDDTSHDQRHPEDESGAIDACGVKRTLVGDAGVANGIGEAAVSQEAPPTVHDGPHHRHEESDG